MCLHIAVALPNLSSNSDQTLTQVHLFLGYGAKAQYADVTEVLQGMERQLLAIQERCAGKVGRPSWFLFVKGRISHLAVKKVCVANQHTSTQSKPCQRKIDVPSCPFTVAMTLRKRVHTIVRV